MSEEKTLDNLKAEFNPFDRFTEQPQGERTMCWMYMNKDMLRDYNNENPEQPLEWGCGVCGAQAYDSLVMMTAMTLVCDGCFEYFTPRPPQEQINNG